MVRQARFLLEPQHHEPTWGGDAMAKYERLSPVDRTFLDLEYPEAHMHVAGVMVFDASPLRTRDDGIDIGKIRKYIASRLHLIPRYRQRIARIPLSNITCAIPRCHGRVATRSSSD
jgi:hypothetical protein